MQTILWALHHYRACAIKDSNRQKEVSQLYASLVTEYIANNDQV